jgi:molecular chaperone DnaK
VAAGAALQGAALGNESVEVLLLDVTALSLGVETGGGIFTVLIPRNTTIPTEKGEIFTTSVDNQTFVPVHVLQGERKMSENNRSLARFELTGIPPAPRGIPKIQVAFRIDADGIVSVEAKDLGTGKAQSIKVKAASGLSQGVIDGLVRDADKFKDADDIRRQLAELRNQAETLLYTTEAALEGYADLVDVATLEDTRGLARGLRGLLESHAELALIRDAYQKLEAMTFSIAERMYGGEGGGGAAPPAQA